MFNKHLVPWLIRSIIVLFIFLSILGLWKNTVVAQDWCDGGCNPDTGTCQECPNGQSCEFNVCTGGCTSDSQCGGSDVCCRGSCVGQGQCGGGGGLGCQNHNVDCPAGSTIDTNQPISTRCKNLDQSDRMCEPVGSAQRQTECCKYNDDTCTNPQYTTYNCCPAGTTSTPIEGGAYEKFNSCFTPTTCNDSNDIYVSHYSSPVAGTCYCNCSDDRGCGINCNKREGSWVYNAVTTCRTVTYSCVSNCTATGPTNLNYSNGTLNWTLGTDGTSQKLYVGGNRNEVEAGCPGISSPACAFKNENLVATINSYPIETYLAPSTSYYAMVTNSAGASCNQNSTTLNFTSAPLILDAWWATIDSDVMAQGSLNVAVPTGQFLNFGGPGGYPGVAIYGTTTNLSGSNVSQEGWIANSAASSKVYDYRYFANQIPADTVISTLASNVLDQAVIDANTIPSYGYYWYKFDGSANGLDLNITGPIDIGAKKVILLVNSADFYINAPINLTNGQGFFMVTVGQSSSGAKGNIFVNPTVGGGVGANLEGIYQADNQFKTGTAAIQLRVRGSVAAYGGIFLQRDLEAENANPSELFEFAPDQIMLFPSKLASRKISWKEVAP